MKYTPEQKKKLKNKGFPYFTRYNIPLPDVKIVGEYFIVESKMNNKHAKL